MERNSKEYWKWYNSTPARAEKLRQYYVRTKQHQLESNRKWAKNNLEKRREINRRFYRNNRKRRNAENRKLAAVKKYYLSQKSKDYREKNRDRIKARMAEYHKRRYASDPEYRAGFIHASNVRRCTRKNQTKNPIQIRKYLKETKSKKLATCYYCKRSISTRTIHFDHIVPLSKGGAHSVENLCVSCPQCNLSKKDKTLRDFIKLGQQLLEL